jgi:hypothetical protein
MLGVFAIADAQLTKEENNDIFLGAPRYRSIGNESAEPPATLFDLRKQDPQLPRFLVR